MKYTIRTSKVIVFTFIFFGLIFLPIKEMPIAFSVFLFFYSFLLWYKKIEIDGLDVKYTSISGKKSIKSIEALDTTGVFFLNRVLITGRGGKSIKMYFISNLSKVESLLDKIENLKSNE